MYSSNLYNFVSEYWDGENGTFNLDLEDDILKACVITHDGGLVNEAIKNIRGS
jgi:NAD(P) transhydrogenase subunit alpha